MIEWIFIEQCFIADMSSCQIGIEGAKALAQKQNLTSLDAFYNQIGKTG